MPWMTILCRWLSVVAGPDLPGSRPGEAAVLLQILSAATLPSVQTTPRPHRTQNPASGPCVSSPEGIDSRASRRSGWNLLGCVFEIHTFFGLCLKIMLSLCQLQQLISVPSVRWNMPFKRSACDSMSRNVCLRCPCIPAVILTGQDNKGDELHSVQSGHSAGSDYPAGEFHYTDWGNSLYGHKWHHDGFTWSITVHTMKCFCFKMS